MTRNSLFAKVYGPVAFLAVLSLIGLLAALLGDGILDALSWVTLGIPLGVIAWCFTRPTADSER